MNAVTINGEALSEVETRALFNALTEAVEDSALYVERNIPGAYDHRRAIVRIRQLLIGRHEVDRIGPLVGVDGSRSVPVRPWRSIHDPR